MTTTFEKLLESQHQRQRALDYLWEHPGALATDIIKDLGWVYGTGSTRLYKMGLMGEVFRKEFKSIRPDVNGRTSIQRTYTYWAVAKKTRTADESLQIMSKNLPEKVIRKPRPPKPVDPDLDDRENVDCSTPKWENGRLVNNNHYRPCISNQGGQGAASPRCESSIAGIFL